MVSKEILTQMSKIDILDASPESLVDIGDIHINKSLPIPSQFDDYLAKIKNPYAYISNNTKVKISFSGTEKTLGQALIRYFSNL